MVACRNHLSETNGLARCVVWTRVTSARDTAPALGYYMLTLQPLLFRQLRHRCRSPRRVLTRHQPSPPHLPRFPNWRFPRHQPIWYVSPHRSSPMESGLTPQFPSPLSSVARPSLPRTSTPVSLSLVSICACIFWSLLIHRHSPPLDRCPIVDLFLACRFFGMCYWRPCRSA